MIYTISSSAPGGTDYQSAQAEDAAGIERAIGEIRRTPGGHNTPTGYAPGDPGYREEFDGTPQTE